MKSHSEHTVIADAKANGFMDCRAIRDALGWDKPGPNGNYYSAMGVAYRWLRDAGEEVVYLIPDGPTDVTKSERTGCYPDVFARVLAYKEAVYAKRAHAEWRANLADAIAAREQEGAQTKNMNWDAYGSKGCGTGAARGGHSSVFSRCSRTATGPRYDR